MSQSSFPDSINASMLDRYLAGELSPVDQRDLDLWLAAHPEWQMMTGRLRDLSLDHNLPPMPRDVDTDWEHIRESIQTTSPIACPASASRRWQYAGVGIALVVMVALGVRMGRSRPHAMPAEQTYVTRAGQQATVTLRDGTRIVLAPDTKLSVASDFGDRSRTVTLSGEADFNVMTTTGAPFVVRTGAVSTRVLGTAFSVRRYCGDDTVQVVVRSGRVVATSRGASMTVAAGGGAGAAAGVARVTDSTAIAVNVGDLHAYTDWARGQLVFKRAAIPEMLAIVGRWYGYEFKLRDSALATQNVSVTFKVADPKEMLVVLKGTLDVNMTFDRNVVTLTPRQIRAAPQRVPMRRDLQPSQELGR
jgi:transmembrane sensor